MFVDVYILIATSFSSFEKNKLSILWLRICLHRSKFPQSAAMPGPDWSSGIYCKENGAKLAEQICRFIVGLG